MHSRQHTHAQQTRHALRATPSGLHAVELCTVSTACCGCRLHLAVARAFFSDSVRHSSSRISSLPAPSTTNTLGPLRSCAPSFYLMAWLSCGERQFFVARHQCGPESSRARTTRALSFSDCSAFNRAVNVTWHPLVLGTEDTDYRWTTSSVLSRGVAVCEVRNLCVARYQSGPTLVKAVVRQKNKTRGKFINVHAPSARGRTCLTTAVTSISCRSVSRVTYL